jgi:hypothetical protein
MFESCSCLLQWSLQVYLASENASDLTHYYHTLAGILHRYRPRAQFVITNAGHISLGERFAYGSLHFVRDPSGNWEMHALFSPCAFVWLSLPRKGL